MATNNFKSFGIGAGANVISQSDYEALAALLTGFQSGKASSAQINKAIRQSTVMAYVLAQFISDSAAVDVLDNGNPAAILANLKSGMTKLTPGRILNIQTFTSSGTYVPTPGTKNILVEMVGGGGGGGNASSSATDTVGLGSGGGGGGYLRSYISAVASQLITVGIGGAASTAGGDTGFGALIARGGGAGVSRLNQTWTFANQGVIQQISASGGQASNGNIVNAAGAYGSQPIWTVFGNGTSGAGGGSFFSGTTTPTSGQAAGTNGAIGCGGSGAAANGTTTVQAGGRGGNGIVIITELA